MPPLSQKLCAFLAGLLLPFCASADERWDHRGSVGLLLGPSLEARASSGNAISDTGFRAGLLLGGTWSVGVNGNDLMAWVRPTLGGPRVGWAIGAGYRGYYGYDRLKSFLDIGAVVQLAPFLCVGPRLGGGLQYEMSPTAGVFVGLELQLAAGAGLLLGGGLMIGVQLRSYLLEG